MSMAANAMPRAVPTAGLHHQIASSVANSAMKCLWSSLALGRSLVRPLKARLFYVPRLVSPRRPGKRGSLLGRFVR